MPAKPMVPWQRKHARLGHALVIATDARHFEANERIYTPHSNGGAEEIADMYRGRGWQVDVWTIADVAFAMREAAA